MADQEVAIIGFVFLGDARDQILGTNSFGLRADHDRGAVGVFGADVQTRVSLHLLEADPDIGLNGLDDVT